MPFFSVVIPLYNKRDRIAKTLQSVLDQTFRNYEIVIVNDGSTDGSETVVEEFFRKKELDNNPNFRLIHQTNAGVSAARNKGIAEAKSKYIALLDGDDEWKPDYLATQAALIAKYPEAQIFATNYEFRNEKGETTPTILRKIKFEGEDGILDNYFEVASCSHPPICSINIVTTKEVYQSVGGFPVGIKSGEDLITWARLVCKYRVAYSLKSLPIFIQTGYQRNEKPKRIPPENDFVGQQLIELKKEFNPSKIYRYISFWHKMRGVIFWRLNFRKQSIKESLRAIRFYPLNYKAYALILINLIKS